MKRNGQARTKGQGPAGVGARPGRRNIRRGGLDGARKVEQSISYMMQHLNQPLRVATLAAAVNVSSSHYCALFKRWTGCPPIDYFIHLRMQRACWLFDSTSLNVKEVAAAMGYDDPFYFSRTFKAVNRVPPSEYRMMSDKLKRTIKSTALALPSPNAGHVQAIQGEDRGGIPGLEACEMQTEERSATGSDCDFGKRAGSMAKNEIKSNGMLLEKT